LAEEGVTLLTVALEVGKVGAAVAGERANEARQSARWDGVELSRGNSGQSDDGTGKSELHFDLLIKTFEVARVWM
jgi:hypothetical protein